MQVARVAGNLQFTNDLRRRGIAKIKNVQRIGLAERHDVAAVLDEAHCSDRFVVLLAEPTDLPQLPKRAALFLQSRHYPLGYLPRVDPTPAFGNRARDTQHAVVLRHRILIKQGSRHLT